MTDKKAITIKMFYTLTCHNYKTLKRLLNKVLPIYKNKFEIKQTMANMPAGMFKTMKLGIHSVPALLINR